MTMLLFDAGNSRCKWAWVDQGLFIRSGVLNNSDAVAWQTLKVNLSRLDKPQKILISNVAGAVMEQRLRELCAIWQCPLELVVARAEQCGVKNEYEQAAQLGSDRWAALIAAWHRGRHACLVVNCGTATTVDALSETGVFLGGLILPGIALMQNSLESQTAQLGRVANHQNGVLRDFPRNTPDAIASGVMRATLGAIQYQYQLLAARGKAACILSGGAACNLLAVMGPEVEHVDNLVLLGLQIMGQDCETIQEKEMVAR